ncbi:MerR family transcriptional regulator [Actinoplanes sp. GCM10030250]|uniref:MerR family transcriptional regulator n=1 Tax=Actinoplanes sp. GCM10030250 TaxID=3273376 RepID=UPI00360B9D55
MWTMEQLVDRVQTALAAEYPGAPNGRVREVPDRRSIRWYTTIGLVDRPLGTRGRVSLYGPRHLLQLVAIKRRQASGRTLAEIQAELAGASEEELSAAARIPADLLSTDPPPVEGPPRTGFWKHSPAQQSTTQQSTTQQPTTQHSADQLSPGFQSPGLQPSAQFDPDQLSDDLLSHDQPSPVVGEGATRAALEQTVELAARARSGTPGAGDPIRAVGESGLVLTGVPLGMGVILLIPHPLDDIDRGDLATAARPLLDLLASRGLTVGRDE